MLRVGDIIKFKQHAKLAERHNYRVLEIAENIVNYVNTETNNPFRSTMAQMKEYQYYIHEKAPEHPTLFKETPAIAPTLKVKCKHTDTIDRVFDTFAFKQCCICGKDMGNLKKVEVKEEPKEAARD